MTFSENLGIYCTCIHTSSHLGVSWHNFCSLNKVIIIIIIIIIIITIIIIIIIVIIIIIIIIIITDFF